MYWAYGRCGAGVAENYKVTVAEVPSVSVHTLTELGQKGTFVGEDACLVPSRV